MAGTRKSTRQSASTAPKYADPSSSASETEASKRNAKKAPRRKRAREASLDEDADGVDAETSPPPRKTARKARTAQPASKPTTTATTSSTPTTLSPLEPSTESNRDASGRQEVFWLLKAEPLPRFENGVNVAFSIDDLRACAAPEPWTGVRNALACKNMRAMRAGDLGFFYHSNAKPSGVAGILRVVEEAKVDESAFDEKDPYHDAKSKKDKPRWFCVGVEFVKKFDDVVDLAAIKARAQKGGALEGMQLVTNSRLSVSRVRREEWDVILEMAGEKDGEGESNGDRKSDEEVNEGGMEQGGSWAAVDEVELPLPTGEEPDI